MVLKEKKLSRIMRQLLILLLLLPIAGEAQKLRQIDLDAGTGKQKLESFPVTIKTASDIRMDVSLSATDSAFFLQLAGTGVGASTVNIDDQVIFLLDNDSTVTIKSAALQDFENNPPVASYRHIYPISQEDLEYLSQHNIQGVRKYSVKGFDDIFPDDSNAANLKSLSAFFLQELDKAHLLKAKPVRPAFPGGMEVLLSFLNRNFKPAQPLPEGERKTAMIQFQVEPDGSIEQIAITQSAGAPYDNELLRILKRMPKWKPGRENGRQVRAVVTHQVEFYQQDSKVRLRL
jgi:TonB family protein